MHVLRIVAQEKMAPLVTSVDEIVCVVTVVAQEKMAPLVTSVEENACPENSGRRENSATSH
jgi:hypothetical protein